MLYIKLKVIWCPTIHFNVSSSQIDIQRVLIKLVGKGHFDFGFDLLPPQMHRGFLVCSKDTSPECSPVEKLSVAICLRSYHISTELIAVMSRNLLFVKDFVPYCIPNCFIDFNSVLKYYSCLTNIFHYFPLTNRNNSHC